jgi:hypothetical protein
MGIKLSPPVFNLSGDHHPKEDKENQNHNHKKRKPSAVSPLNEFECTQKYDIVPWKFENGKWTQSHKNIDYNYTKHNPNLNEIIVVTYNVWFSNFHAQERRTELFKIITEKKSSYNLSTRSNSRIYSRS